MDDLIVSFGKYQGRKINTIEDYDYLLWAAENLSSDHWRSIFADRLVSYQNYLEAETKEQMYCRLMRLYADPDEDDLSGRLEGFCQNVVETHFSAKSSLDKIKQTRQIIIVYFAKVLTIKPEDLTVKLEGLSKLNDLDQNLFSGFWKRELFKICWRAYRKLAVIELEQSEKLCHDF